MHLHEPCMHNNYYFEVCFLQNYNSQEQIQLASYITKNTGEFSNSNFAGEKFLNDLIMANEY